MRCGAIALLCLVAVPLGAPAREIAGTVILPGDVKLPDAAELHIRLTAPDAPPQDLRRVAAPADLSFTLATAAQGRVTLAAALHAGGRPLLAADPVTIDAGSGPVALELRPAVLAGHAAPFRCGPARIALAPDPGGLVLHRDGSATRLAGPPEGPLVAAGVTLTPAGNRVTLATGSAAPVTCLPDIPAPLFPLSAGGTEPVWSVSVSRAAMALALSDGATELGRAPDLRPVPGGLVIFAAPDMNLTLGPGPCADAGTGAIHPFSATFAMPGLTLTGCGGDPAQALAGAWTVTGIAGLPLAAEPRPGLSFDGATLSGDTGCNSLTATLAWEGAALQVGPVATTRRACPAPSAEAALLQALPTVTRATWDPRLSVVRLLSGDTPAVTLERPAPQ